jgi:hypothetical protein
VEHLDAFSGRLRASGYDETYRMRVIKSEVEGFDRMAEVARSGGRPINRPRTWEEDLRHKKKELKKQDWFRPGGFLIPRGGNWPV